MNDVPQEIISGIYCIRNIIDNKRYVGSAVNLKNRKSKHFSELKKNIHRNHHLQNAFNKCGIDVFLFEILEFIEDLDQLLNRENYYIELYDATNPDFGYNSRKEANSNIGVKYFIKDREALANRARGNKYNLGRKQTQETKDKISKNRSGIPCSEEQKIAVSNKLKGRVPYVMTDAIRENISKAKKGKPPSYVMTDDIREKISKARKGKPGLIPNDETRRKMSKSQRERKRSPATVEARKNMSEAQKGLKNHNHTDNISDEKRQQMSERMQGSKCPTSKLTEEEVMEIKKMIRDGIRNIDISKIFNVSPDTISGIKIGRSWKHVKLEDEDPEKEQ